MSELIKARAFVNAQRGFTLVELVVTTLVIAVLAAIALPSYQEHAAKARRGEAAAALMTGAQALERYYSANGTYLGADGKLAAVFPKQVPENGTAYYTLSAPEENRNSFTLRATRVGSGVMAKDACGDLELTQSGARQLNDNTKLVDECWRR